MTPSANHLQLGDARGAKLSIVALLGLLVVAACVTPGEVTVDPTIGGGTCFTAADCPGETTACQSPACTDDVCRIVFEPPATPCGTDLECDGQGACLGCGAACGSECGNSITEFGEDCDEGGVESATCDADCTAPACGDGVLNALAGEACEDFNADPDDGCTAECQAEGTCDVPFAIDLTPDKFANFDAQFGARIGGVDAPSDAGSCDGESVGAVGPQRVYSFAIAAPTSLSVEVASDVDVQVRLRSAACAVGTELAEFDGDGDGCSNATAGGGVERMTFRQLPAGTYFLEVTVVEPGAAANIAARIATLRGTSCRQLNDDFGPLESGAYMLDSDGTGNQTSYNAYCDHDNDAGGWTLVARFAGADSDHWDTSGGTFFRNTTTRGLEAEFQPLDMVSFALGRVDAEEFRISRADDAAHGTLVRSTGGCVGGMTFLEKLYAAAGQNSISGGWGNVAAAPPLTCPLVVAPTAAATAGFGFIGCGAPTATINDANQVMFLASEAGLGTPGSVMLFGGAGGGCGTADHGIGVSTESDFSSSNWSDFGENPTDPLPVYGLDLWVR